MDVPDTANTPQLSSILDDTFYLLKLVLKRSLSCGSITTLGNLREKVVEAIERDYIAVIKKKIEGIYSNTSVSQDRNADKSNREHDQTSSFIVCPLTQATLIADLPQRSRHVS